MAEKYQIRDTATGELIREFDTLEEAIAHADDEDLEGIEIALGPLVRGIAN
jgi:hypothetical protein